MAKITWKTSYSVLYWVNGSGGFQALTGTWKLIKFGGFSSTELFFQGETGGNTILVPATNIAYARVVT